MDIVIAYEDRNCLNCFFNFLEKYGFKIQEADKYDEVFI